MSISRPVLRDLTMKLVFQYNFYPNPELDEAVRLFLSLEESLTDEDRLMIAERAKDIFTKIADIDDQINQKADKWSTARMSKVDLSIIRLAVYEMQNDPEVPEKVAVNEAVELAKTYGGDQSPKFVNGVLKNFMTEA